MKRLLPPVVVLCVLAALPASASAGPVTSLLAGQTIGGGAIPCPAQSDGVRVCHGTDNGGGASDRRLRSFDGVALEIYVILPAAPSGPGADGPYPLVVQSHGWGGSARGPDDTDYFGPTADALAKDGYAVIQLTARGFGDSCGKSTPPAAMGPCANGYVRLDDERYEARDVQYAAGLLVDAGLVKAGAIGVTGESYGGGVSLELATLNDRVMNADGSLRPWTSPHGTPLHIAAAAPVIPWSDLVYSLMPNGRTRDDTVTPPVDDVSPIGVEKQSFVTGLFALGTASGTYSASDPQANLSGWYATINAGEPYESNPMASQLVTQIAHFHSPYYLLAGAYGMQKKRPAPLLIANGYMDDLFPVDEAVHYYNLERSLYPGAAIGLVDGDFGHQRGQNKAADTALVAERIQGLFDHYLKGASSWRGLGATTFVETCPGTAASGGPYRAATWSALHPGQVFYSSAAAQAISSGAGDPAISSALDPITGKGACATVSASDQGSGVATYRLPAATGNGYTLLGASTVTANLSVTGSGALIAERLWDVDPSAGTQTLVARGAYRIDSAHPNGVQRFQLHPGAWHFAAGHIAKLELLSRDSPYLRTSNGTFQIQLSNLQLVLPVHESPGAPSVEPFGTDHSARCTPVPRSRIQRARALRRRRGLVVSGTASETRCAGQPARVVVVHVIVRLGAGRGRCRFLTVAGRLSATRACSRPVRLRARGTSHWRLVVRGSLPPGRYLVIADAVDGSRHHQRPGSRAHVRVRLRR